MSAQTDDDISINNLGESKNNFNLNFRFDLVDRYVCQDLDLGNVPNIQLYMSLGISGFCSLYYLSNEIIATDELDTYLTYTVNSIYYGTNSFSIINLGFILSKELRITEEFSIPIFSSFFLNPKSEKSTIVFGISL